MRPAALRFLSIDRASADSSGFDPITVSILNAMKARRLLTLALFLYLAPSVAVAAVKTWTGQSGGRWSTASNWSPAGAPADKDALSFPLLPAGRVKAMTNDLAGRTFQDLTFTTNGYTLRGEALALTAGIHANQPNLGNTIETPVTLSGHQTFNVASASGTLLLLGDINLNRANLAIDGRGNLNASGVIRNRGSVVLTGDNTVTFFGARSNQLEGTVWVQSGTLILNKVSGGVGQIAVPGDLIVGSSGAASVRLAESGQIAAGSAVTIYQNCLLDLDGQTNTVGSLRFVGGGTVQAGTGRLVLGGDVAVEGLGKTAVIAGNLHLGNSDRTFTVGDVAGSVDLDVTARVSAGTSGAPLYIGRGLTKAGSGTMRLAGANTYGGATDVDEGALAIGHGQALGAGGGLLAGTRVNANGQLRLDGVQVPDEPLMLSRAASSGHVLLSSGDSIWGGTVTLNTDSRLSSSGTLVLSNRVSGAGGLLLDGNRFEFAGADANTYAGTTWVDCAIVRLNHSVPHNNAIPGNLVVGANSPDASNVVQYALSQQIADTARVTLHLRSVLDLNGRADWISELEFVGGLAPQHGHVQSGAGFLGVSNQVAAAEFAVGSIAGNLKLAASTVFAVTTNGNVLVPAMIQEGGLTLRGGGNLKLQGINTFAGPVVIERGLLFADGNFALGAITGKTTVQPEGTLNLQPSVTSLNEPLTLGGSGVQGTGALQAYGDVTLPNTITLASDTVVFVETNRTLEITGAIGGAGDLIFDGPGKVTLSGTAPNTYTGTTWFKGGGAECRKTAAHGAIPGPLVVGDLGTNTQAYVELTLFNLPQINALAPVVLHKLGALRPQGDGEEILGSIAGDGRILFGLETNATALLIGGNNASTAFNGEIHSFNRNLRLAKRGSGQLTLGEAARVSLHEENVWTIEAGALCVNGRVSYGDMRVLRGAVLCGSGELPSVTVSGGLLAPGEGLGGQSGLLSFGHLALESNAVVAIDIQGAADPALHDQVIVRSWMSGDGEITITNCTLEVSLDAIPAEGVALPIAVANASGDDAPIRGRFTGLPDGAMVSVPPFSFRINYNAQPDSDDQQVTLTLVNPPLESGPAQVVGNNVVPGRINPFECDALFIPFTNTLAIPLTGIRAVLSSPSGGLLVTQPESVYPDIPPGGVGVNLTPFQVSTFKSLQNGADIEVRFTTPDAPSFSASVHVDVGTPGPTYRFNNPASHTIPGRKSVDVPVDADSFDGTIESVQASLHLTHPNIGDLELALVAHDGQTVLLSRALGGTNDAYGAACADRMRTTFTDTARTPIGKSAPPFAGAYRPIEPLAAFAGKEYSAWSDGPWRLRIVNRGHLAAELECWSLYLTQLRSTNGSGGCLTCIEPILATLTTNHPVHLGLLDTDGPTSCARPNNCRIDWTRTEIVDDETWPFVEVTNTMYYQTHAFTNTGPATCASAAVSAPSSSWPSLYAAAYLGAFNPDAPCENYLGDVGQPAGAWHRSFSFDVPVGARFVLVVSMSTKNRSPIDYQLLVTGGNCPPAALAIAPDAAPGKVAVSWSTAAAGYQLETSPAPSPPGFTRSTLSPAVVDGQFVVTNTAAGTSRYYRLHRP